MQNLNEKNLNFFQKKIKIAVLTILNATFSNKNISYHIFTF